MFKVSKTIRWEAAHHLPHHQGLCRRPHGHSFVAKLILTGGALQESGSSVGMLQDFKEISDAVKPIIESCLDHHDLNETLPMENPTSEEIARWLYMQLKDRLPLLSAVIVEETCTSEATYEP
jgi:6-pyruvoyltetrahydropterin/6-carboxytetrahydropterin synthase